MNWGEDGKERQKSRYLKATKRLLHFRKAKRDKTLPTQAHNASMSAAHKANQGVREALHWGSTSSLMNNFLSKTHEALMLLVGLLTRLTLISSTTEHRTNSLTRSIVVRDAFSITTSTPWLRKKNSPTGISLILPFFQQNMILLLHNWFQGTIINRGSECKRSLLKYP